ncbi:MAG: hypothetical protein IOD12_11230 [Silvanigrellales bacterium]|nr:hypothetical protein [Silvanigrellales bacterium]
MKRTEIRRPEKTRPVLLAFLAVLAFAASGAPSLAFAQSPTDPKSKQGTITDAKGRKVTVIDFDDANIEGRAKAPDGFLLQARSSGKFKNIIELRRNFRPQMQGSAYEALIAVPASP